MTGAIEFPLLLQRDPDHGSESLAAVYLPGGDAGQWIGESTSWQGVDQASLRFLPLPVSPDDPSIGGVIVYSAAPMPDWKSRFRGTPLKESAGKLLLPFGTRLRYPVSAAEMQSLVSDDFLALLPGGREYAFNKEEGYTLADLIAPFEVSTTTWNLARAPEFTLPDLREIGISHLPDIDELMDAGRDDIGGSHPDGLPRTPEEKPIRDGLRNLTSLPGKAFYKAIQKLSGSGAEAGEKSGAGKSGGAGAGNPASLSWASKLNSWAAGNLEDLLGKQNQELDRLLALMKADPDKGLGFALPLGQSGGGRGVSNPGTQLPRRNVSFNLGSLFGSGGAIAPWMADGDRYHRLQQAYREAANRELTLRRFRRAAYIFGHLLSDFQAAANALEQGGFHREAAVIYEKKLDLPDKAAEAFRKGGLFDDALRLYRKQKKHEECGKLLREIGREEEAVEAFDLAIDFHTQRDEPVEAARISRSALANEERALTIYRNAWPNSKAAAECLDLEFRLLAQQQEHTAAHERIEDLQATSVSTSQVSLLTKQFLSLSRDYPNREVATHAADATRRYAGNQAIQRNLFYPAVSQFISGLDPNDRILSRDADRFAAKKLQLPPPTLASPAFQGGEDVTVSLVEQRGHFPEGSSPIAGFGFDHGLFLAKISRAGDLVLSYNPSEGLVSSETWSRKSFQFTKNTLLRYVPVRSLFHPDDRAIVAIGENAEFCRTLRPAPEPRISLGSHPFFTPDTITAASGRDGQTWRLRSTGPGTAVLETSYKCTIGATYEIALHQESTFSAGMIVSGTQVFFAVGSYAYCWSQGRLSFIPLPYHIVSLSLPEHGKNLPIAVGMEHGAALVYFSHGETEYRSVGRSDLRNVRVGYTGSNHLVLASEKRIDVISVFGSGAVHKCGLEHASIVKPICVAPRKSPLEFLVATSKQILKFALKT